MNSRERIAVGDVKFVFSISAQPVRTAIAISNKIEIDESDT
jgi:hypothetical protein